MHEANSLLSLKQCATLITSALYCYASRPSKALAGLLRAPERLMQYNAKVVGAKTKPALEFMPIQEKQSKITYKARSTPATIASTRSLMGTKCHQEYNEHMAYQRLRQVLGLNVLSRLDRDEGLYQRKKKEKRAKYPKKQKQKKPKTKTITDLKIKRKIKSKKMPTNFHSSFSFLQVYGYQPLQVYKELLPRTLQVIIIL